MRPMGVALGFALAAVAAWTVAADVGRGQPILVTVDDLPVATGRLHIDPAERERITKGLLATLAKHHVPAVGFVIWGNVAGPADVGLLEQWLAAGQELGNHSKSHLGYSRIDPDDYIADTEAGRAGLAALLQKHGRTVRFFRFPYLSEGPTLAKLDAMRAYLILHANEVGSAQWDGLLTWLEARGYRFAPADEVLADPAIATPHRYDKEPGSSLWCHIEHDRQAVLDRYAARQPTRDAMGTLSLEPIEAREAWGNEVTLLGDAVPSRVRGMSLVARWTLRAADGSERTGLTLLVFLRRAGRWVIVQDASM